MDCDKRRESAFTIFRVQFRGNDFSDDTPIAPTGIKEGSRIHCILKLAGGARSRQTISVIAMQKVREAKIIAHRRMCEMITGKSQLVNCATILISDIS
jgi:hypothetical protein